MSKIIAAAASIIILAALVVLIRGQSVQGSATAAPQPTTQRVAEQNLDGNGNIKVHDQGVVNVALQPNAGTTTTILDADVSGPFFTAFTNAENCNSRMVLFAERSASLAFNDSLAFSPSDDGITSYNVIFSQLDVAIDGRSGWTTNHATAYLDVTGHNTGPFMRFGVSTSTSQHVTIKLYCR